MEFKFKIYFIFGSFSTINLIDILFSERLILDYSQNGEK